MPLVSAACRWGTRCGKRHTFDEERGNDTPEWLRDLKLINVPIRVQLCDRVVHCELPSRSKLFESRKGQVLTARSRQPREILTHLLVFPVESQGSARILDRIVIARLCKAAAHVNIRLPPSHSKRQLPRHCHLHPTVSTIQSTNGSYLNIHVEKVPREVPQGYLPLVLHVEKLGCIFDLGWGHRHVDNSKILRTQCPRKAAVRNIKKCPNHTKFDELRKQLECGVH
eukprot:COSAG02_NODE_1983_length_10192_cov_119.688231_5_plen_226_part_00